VQYFSGIMARANELEPTVELLNELQLRFVHTAVYSNLEVILGNMPTLVPNDAYQSVVIDNEGGSCRNLNLAFYHILDAIGFKVHLVAPFVVSYDQYKQQNNRPTHLAIIVTIDDDRYLVDPGWSNGSRIPIPLNGNIVSHVMGTYRAIRAENGTFVVLKKFDQWVIQLTFDPNEAMHYSDFQEQMEFIYSDASLFRNFLIVTNATPDYSICLYNNELDITFADGHIESRVIDRQGGISHELKETFGLSPKYINAVTWDKEKVLEKVYLKLQPIW
jgi:N-hydroxyarylamine O-acetyltransferase